MNDEYTPFENMESMFSPGTTLGMRDIAVKKTDNVSAIKETLLSWEIECRVTRKGSCTLHLRTSRKADG